MARTACMTMIRPALNGGLSGRVRRTLLCVGLWAASLEQAFAVGAQVTGPYDPVSQKIPEPVEQPADPTDRAPLRGTIVSPRAELSRAIILTPNGQQRIYARGDVIAGDVSVAEIHSDHVVLHRGGQRVTLIFSWERPVAVIDTIVRAVPLDERWETLRTTMLSQPGLFLQLIGTVPDVQNGRFRGFRVIERDDRSLLEYLGLQPGDLMIAVNDLTLAGTNYGAQLLESLSGTENLTYTVQRGDRMLVLGK